MKSVNKLGSQIETQNVEAANSIAAVPVSPEAVAQAAREFLEMKKEADRVAAVLSKLRKFLEPELMKRPELQIEVDNKILYLCPTTKRDFDYEAAKEKLSDTQLKKLKPYTEVVEVFDLKAAEKHLDDKTLKCLKPFIEIRVDNQFRTKDKKEGE